ncbi:MAG: transposase [Deltaproteobacteria bacterium]|nr:transposase [Deltaproteobacteria bacterium]
MEKESRQVRRARQRVDEKEKKRITKELQLSDFTYVADDNNVTLSAVAPQIIDFMKVTGMPGHLRKHVSIEKRKSTFRSDMISQLMILQNILGYDRIENSRTLNQDHILKEKLSIDNYPDPETFRDELMKYKPENMEQLLLVNPDKSGDVICNLKVGYNPHKHGRKSYHLKVCTIEPFGFILAIQLEPGTSVSYLLTYEKGLYLYLYLLLDEYSRKIIQWLINWHQAAEEARYLLEQGLIGENILDLPEDQRPEIINDRGRQMKAKSIKRMFEDHHMPQLFARPRTPNDNPFVESLFGTIKTNHQYPGRFRDCAEACKYFGPYFHWYNTEHLHSGIDYVTPEQCHQGLREQIVDERKAKLKKQRVLRKEVNCRGQIICWTNYLDTKWKKGIFK